MRTSNETSSQRPIPLRLFAWILISTCIAWSFQFTSFNHAKEVVLLIGLLMSGTFFLKRHHSASNVLLSTLFFTILFYGFLQVVFNRSGYTEESLIAWARVIFFSLFVAIIASVLTRQQLKELIFLSVMISSVVVAFLALGQEFHINLFLFPKVEGYTQSMYSVFGNQNLLGGYMATGAIMVASRLTQMPVEKRYLFSFLLLTIVLILSESRTAWLAAGMGIFIVVLQRKKTQSLTPYYVMAGTFAIAILVGAISTTVYQKILQTGSSEDVSFGLRQWIWAGSFSMWKDFAIGGTGLGNFAYHSPSYLGGVLDSTHPNRFVFNQIHTWHAHSDALEILIHFGVFGFAILAFAVWSIVRCPQEMKPVIITMTVFSVFNTTLHSAPFALLWLLVLSYSLFDDRRAPSISRTNQVRWIAAMAAGSFILFATIWPSFLLNRARNQFDNEGEIGPTLVSYERASTPWGAPPETYLEWAILEIEEGRFEESIAILKRIDSRIDTGELHFAFALSYENIGETELAIRHYKLTIERWPRHRPAWEGLLNIMEDEEKSKFRVQFEAWFTDSKV